MMSNDRLVYIDSLPALRDLASELTDGDWVAVDTEFIRDRTYFPKFCLLQLANHRLVACIDTLAVDDLSPLDPLFDDDHTVKVFHSCRQDLEILYRLRGRLPKPLFDTQVAAPFLGFQEQIGYSTLVAELLKVHLPKSHTRTDWSVRPLTPAQLKYAADDVIYLGVVYQSLVERLAQLGRRNWVEEEIRYLEDPEIYDPPPQEAWSRISGIAQLNPAQAGILRDLAAWRENLARQQDCPRNWLIKDELLLELAKQRPKDMPGLKAIRGLDERTVRRHAPSLLQLLTRASTPIALPLRSRAASETLAQDALLDILSAVVRLRAAEHTINPAILASRRNLKEFIESPSGSPLTKGWRRTLVGEDLAAMLAGRKSLKVTQSRIHIVDHDQ